WGVRPSLVIEKSRLNILLANTIQGLHKVGLISDECTYIMTAGYPTGAIGSTNFIRILKKDQIDYYLDAAL
ncbi:hypothetical protein CFT12S02855_08125, partial [Campylobacter fetus subsp. testudinum]